MDAGRLIHEEARRFGGSARAIADPARPGPAAGSIHAAADINYRFVVRLVAFAAQVSLDQMLSRARGSAEVVRARQLAMYLLHTKLSLPFNVVAALFRRDRTTVAHACSAMEDLRDIPERDDFIGELEAMLELAFSMTSCTPASTPGGLE